MTELKNLVALAVANTMIASLVTTSSTVNAACGEVVIAGMNWPSAELIRHSLPAFDCQHIEPARCAGGL